MTLCCARCFNDRHLKRQIIPDLSKENGKCFYCHSENQALVNPILLIEQFELLISIYTPADDGKLLAELLKENWAMFPSLDIVYASMLLGNILDDGDIVRQRFKPATSSTSNALIQWSQLRTELMHKNRFFPNTEIDLERLRNLMPHLLAQPDNSEIPTTWYRARIQEGLATFPITEMGAPPESKVSHGRANPAGIPYLYLASNALTAISEVRPHTGEFITIATFSIPTGLKLLDLRHPRQTVSPFVLSDENEVLLLLNDIEFLERLGNELTRPVLQKSAAYDYIPSQYLCEYAKKCGFDGVLYQSSVGNSINVAIFDPAQGIAQTVETKRVSRVEVSISNVSN